MQEAVKPRAEVLAAMWLAAQSRGRDAAGLAVVGPDGEAQVVKAALPASTLVNKRTPVAMMLPGFFCCLHSVCSVEPGGNAGICQEYRVR